MPKEAEAPAEEATVKSYDYGSGKKKKLIKTNTNHVLTDRLGPGMKAGSKVKVLAIFENGDVIIEHKSKQRVLDENRNWVDKDMPTNIRVSKTDWEKNV